MCQKQTISFIDNSNILIIYYIKRKSYYAGKSLNYKIKQLHFQMSPFRHQPSNNFYEIMYNK